MLAVIAVIGVIAAVAGLLDGPKTTRYKVTVRKRHGKTETTWKKIR